MLESPDAFAQVENPVCGDVLRLAARIANGRISEVKFLAKGCVPAMACASAITELVNGKTIDEASAVTTEQIRKSLRHLPAASSHAAQLAVDALAALLKRYQAFGRVPSGQ